MAATRVVVHGGAGREAPETAAARAAGVERAADAGWGVLAAGGTALDAVIAAVVVLEDDPYFNAGTGAVVTEDGAIELDASVMDGPGLRAGAVGAVVGVANPVLLARAILEEGREVLRVGPSATAMAARCGLRLATPGSLATTRRAPASATGDTVGAVARDARGHVAAATSTGGLMGKRRGRVGDSAVIGAGTYADDALGAVSCTGPGEAIVRAVLAHRTLAHVERGQEAQAAAEAALASLRERTGATAGLVVVDAAGRVGIAHTTPTMPTARRG